MGAVPDRRHRPQYGWCEFTLIQDESISQPGGVNPDTTARVARPNGLYRVTVSGRVEAGTSAGTGAFGFVVEGSNTGDIGVAAEWTEVGRTCFAELFQASDASLQAKALALSGGASTSVSFIGEATLPVDRWRYLRVRSFVQYEDGGDPVIFDMSIRMTGIGADGEQTVLDNSLIRTSGDTTEPTSTVVQKPAGVRFVSAQAYVNSMINDGVGATGFDLILQAALNQDAVDNDQWLTIDVTDPVTAAADVQFFQNGQVRLVDLNGFEFFRFTAQKDAGVPPSDLSSYDISCYTVFDDADWIDGETGIANFDEALRKTFVMVMFTPVTGVAPNVEITVQVCDMNQIPIRSRRRIGLLLSVTEDGFTDDLSPAATFTSVTAPATLPYGAGGNVAVVQTDDDGQATIQIALGGAVNCFIAAWNQWIPNVPSNGFFGPGQIIIATDRADVVP